MAKSLFDEIGIEQVNTIMKEVSRKAIAQAHTHGLPVVVVIDGIISRLYPDNRVEPIKPTQEFTPQKTLVA